MKPPKPKSIANYLTATDNSLQSLVETAYSLQTLNQIVLSQFTPDFTEHCVVMCYHQGILTLGVANAAWGTKLRYDLPTLKFKLAALPEFAELTDIKYKIAPELFQPEQPSVHSKLKISAENADLICEAAANITNEKLKIALAKLADRNNEKNVEFN